MILEWYLWENFSEVEEIGKGGYGTVFHAKPKVGRINKWDHEENQWSHYQQGGIYYNEYFALKTMEECELKDFLNEVTNLFFFV